MAASDSFELLQALLAGGTLSPAELDAFLAKSVSEDLHLDYKSGQLKDPAQVVRQYVSGFANSEGGVLAIGVDDNCKIDGFKVPGGKNAISWATNTLTSLAGYLSPPPRISSVAHANGEVLLIAVDRAPSLVPVVERGEAVHYVRIGDSTVKVPPYLLTDLLLGRRQHPRVECELALFDFGAEKAGSGWPGMIWKVSFRLNVRNMGPQWIENYRVGTLSWQIPRNGVKPAGQELRGQVDAGEAPDNGLELCFAARKPTSEETDSIDPFSVSLASQLGQIVLPGMPLYYTWRCGICLLPKGSPPTWYELECYLNAQHTSNLRPEARVKEAKLVRSQNRRPNVAWTIEDQFKWKNMIPAFDLGKNS